MDIRRQSLTCYTAITLSIAAAASSGGPIRWDERWSPETSVPKAVDPTLMRHQTSIGSYDDNLGVAGIVAADLDRDGIPEIVVGDRYRWFVVAHDPVSDAHSQRFFHEVPGPTSSQDIAALDVGDVDADGELEVVLLIRDRWVQVHDGLTGALETEWQLNGTGDANLLHLADVGPAPGEELIVTIRSDLHVHELQAAAPTWSVLGTGGSRLATGQVDADPQLEILVARGGADGWVIDTATRALEWGYPGGFGPWVAAGDLDNDGMDEIACLPTGAIQAIDGDTQVVKWSNTLDRGAENRIHCADFDGDGIDEVLTGEGSRGDVKGFDGFSGSLVFAIGNPASGVSDLTAGDVDGDCEAEAIWGAGYATSGRDGLYVGDLTTEMIEWEHLQDDGPMYGVAVGDIDGDGQTEVLRVSEESNTGFDGHLVYVWDLQQNRNEFVPAAPLNGRLLDHRGVAVGQLDADPQLEYVLGDEIAFSGLARAFDGLSHQEEWASGATRDVHVSAVAIDDVDGDGTPEVVVGTSTRFGATERVVRVIRGSDGFLLWQSAPLPNAVLDLRLADIDADPQLEILATVRSDGLHVFDGLTHVSEWVQPLISVSAIDTGDLDGDLDDDVLLGTASGGLLAFDGLTHANIWGASAGTAKIHALRVADVDVDGTPEIVLGQGPFSRSTVQIRDLATQALIWESHQMTGEAGTASSLVVADADDDGQTEILVGTSESIQVFELADGGPDVTPPTFSGVEAADTISSPTCCPSVDLSWTPARDAQSPPLVYRVYRDTAPGVTPGAVTFIAESAYPGYRDSSTMATTDYHYVVRAVDQAGNEDANLTEASVTTLDPTPPVAPLITVTDVDSCTLGAMQVEFTHSGTPTGVTFDLLFDGMLAASDITSPHVHDPGDGANHFYAVVAVHPDCPLSTASITVGRPDVGDVLAAPVLTAVTDDDACATSGVTITFTHAGFVGNGHYDLLVDGMVVQSPVVSPVAHVPPDAMPRDYAIRAVDDDCARSSDSSPLSMRDSDGVPMPAVIDSIAEISPCGGQVRIDFTHAGFPGSGHYELWRDGSIFLAPITSGQTFPTGDTASHDYVIRAVDDQCNRSSDSAVFPFAASPTGPGAPIMVVIDDLDPCAPSSLRLTFTHPGFTGNGHYELWRDAVLFLSPVVSGQVFPPGDDREHGWSVRAVDDDCSEADESAPVRAADLTSCSTNVTITVRRDQATGELALAWTMASGAIAYDAYVGTVSSLSGARVYDHVKDGLGAVFPDSPTPATGCDVSGGTSLAARAASLPAGNLYLLIVAVDASGVEGPYGPNSFGVDRHDPTLDPRPPATFCP